MSKFLEAARKALGHSAQVDFADSLASLYDKCHDPAMLLEGHSLEVYGMEVLNRPIELDRSIDDYMRAARANAKFLDAGYVIMARNGFFRMNRASDFLSLLDLACNNLSDANRVAPKVLKARVKAAIVSGGITPDVLAPFTPQCKLDLENVALSNATGVLSLLGGNPDTSVAEKQLAQAITQRGKLFQEQQGGVFKMPPETTPQSSLDPILFSTNPLAAAADTAFVLFTARLARARRAVGLGNVSWSAILSHSFDVKLGEPRQSNDQITASKLEALQAHQLFKAVRLHLSSDFFGTRGLRELVPVHFRGLLIATALGQTAHKEAVEMALEAPELCTNINLHRHAATLGIKHPKDTISKESFDAAACLIGREAAEGTLSPESVRSFLMLFADKPFSVRVLRPFVDFKALNILSGEEGTTFINSICTSALKRIDTDGFSDAALLGLITPLQLLQMHKGSISDGVAGHVEKMLTIVTNVTTKLLAGQTTNIAEHDTVGEVLYEALTLIATRIASGNKSSLTDKHIRSLGDIAVTLASNPPQAFKGLAMLSLRLLSLTAPTALSPRSPSNIGLPLPLPMDPLNIFSHSANSSQIQHLALLPMTSLRPLLALLAVGPMGLQNPLSNSSQLPSSILSSLAPRPSPLTQSHMSSIPGASLYATVNAIAGARGECFHNQTGEMVDGLLSRGAGKAFIDMLWLRTRALLDCYGILSAVFVGLLGFIQDTLKSLTTQTERHQLVGSSKLLIPNLTKATTRDILSLNYIDNTDRHIMDELTLCYPNTTTIQHRFSEAELKAVGIITGFSIPQAVLDTEFLLFSCPTHGQQPPPKAADSDRLAVSVAVCCYNAVDAASRGSSTETQKKMKAHVEALLGELATATATTTTALTTAQEGLLPPLCSRPLLSAAFSVLVSEEPGTDATAIKDIETAAADVASGAAPLSLLALALPVLVTSMILKAKRSAFSGPKAAPGNKAVPKGKAMRGRGGKSPVKPIPKPASLPPAGQPSLQGAVINLLTAVGEAVARTHLEPQHPELLSPKAASLFKLSYTHALGLAKGWCDELQRLVRMLSF